MMPIHEGQTRCGFTHEFGLSQLPTSGKQATVRPNQPPPSAGSSAVIVTSDPRPFINFALMWVVLAAIWLALLVLLAKNPFASISGERPEALAPLLLLIFLFLPASAAIWLFSRYRVCLDGPNIWVRRPWHRNWPQPIDLNKVVLVDLSTPGWNDNAHLNRRRPTEFTPPILTLGQPLPTSQAPDSIHLESLHTIKAPIGGLVDGRPNYVAVAAHITCHLDQDRMIISPAASQLFDRLTPISPIPNLVACKS